MLRHIQIALSFAMMASSIAAFGPMRAAAQDAPTSAPAKEQNGDAIVVPAGETEESIEVHDRPLIIKGHVKGGVRAVNSMVTLMPGARVEGGIDLVGSTLSAEQQPVTRKGRLHFSAGSNRAGNWYAAQFCLWLLGLAAALIVSIAVPQSAARSVDALGERPGHSLLIGAIVVAAITAALAVSGLILKSHTIVSIVWMPVTVVLALGSLTSLMFGWTVGMRRFAAYLSKRLRTTSQTGFFTATAVGLTAFLLANCLLGRMNPALGAFSMFIQFVIAVAGVGAVVRAVFGRDEFTMSRGMDQFRGVGLN